jgi:hypothetical protein
MLKDIPPERDNCGQWMHPELEALFGDREYIPSEEFKAWLASHGIETATAMLEYDCDEDDPLHKAYFEDGDPDLTAWNPEPPGAEWSMLALVDTEDGPLVTWYRPKPSQEA